MKRPTLTAIILASALPLGGCDDKPSDAPATDSSSSSAASTKPAGAKSAQPKRDRVASCNFRKESSVCREYGEDNIDAAGEEFIRGLCKEDEFKMEACPKDGRVGTCKTQEGTEVFYSDGGFPRTAPDAEKACKEGVPAGEWSAGS